MIKFYEFESLNEARQAEILWTEGVYLDLIRKTSRLNVELYALYDFYVELYFDEVTEDPLFLKPVSQITDINPYLDMIDLSELLRKNAGTCRRGLT